MKYVLLFVDSDRDVWDAMPEAEKQQIYARIGEWWEGHAKAGRIVGGHELANPWTATTVRFDRGRENGRPIVTDGPFMEAKETVGGYAVIDMPDLDAAIALAKTWPARSTVEIRPVIVHESE